MANHIRVRDNQPKRRRKRSTSGGTRTRESTLRRKPEHEFQRKHGDNSITLSDLCQELDVDPGRAREYLRAAGLTHTGRWRWRIGTQELAKARKIIKEGARIR